MGHCILDYKRKALVDPNVRFLEIRVSNLVAVGIGASRRFFWQIQILAELSHRKKPN